jgi:hypothetical protein
MADQSDSHESEQPPHRSCIHVQGGRTEKSEARAQATPPTLSEVMRLIDRLEAQLTPMEKKIREKGFAQLRRAVENAARSGGFWAQCSRSFPKPPVGDVRLDIEIITGTACVPDDVE